MRKRQQRGVALQPPLLALVGTVALATGMAIIMAAVAITIVAAPAHAESEEQAGNPVPPPYEQLRQGTPPREILCADHRILVISPDGKPACFWPETAQKLADRGWEIPINATEEGGGEAGGSAQAPRTPEPPDAGAPGDLEPEGSAVEAAATTEVAAAPATPPAGGEPLAVTPPPVEDGLRADGSPEALTYDPRYYTGGGKITLQGVEKKIPNPTGVWMPVTKEEAEQVVMPRLAAALGDKLILPELTDYEFCVRVLLWNCSSFLDESDPDSLSYYPYDTEKGNVLRAWKTSGNPDLISSIKYSIISERVPYEEREEFFRSFMENAGFNVTKIYIGHYNGRIYGGLVSAYLEFRADNKGPFTQLNFRGWTNDYPEDFRLPDKELERRAHAFAAAHVDIWDKEKCSLRLKGVEAVDVIDLHVKAGVPIYKVIVGNCYDPDSPRSGPTSQSVFVEGTAGEIIWPVYMYYMVEDWADRIDIPESAKVKYNDNNNEDKNGS